ncbi:MAG TPA: potassium channel family protein, partial [Rubrobacteraceae bacterium]|nr:potassium channel family protein [Rubrobacteraceae bacterium]
MPGIANPVGLNRLMSSYQGAYALLAALLTVFTGAGLLLVFERDVPDSTIQSFGDALWWAMTTITTVGYGDTYPVTPQGRGLAVVVMV